MIRREMLDDGMATMGTAANGWVLASSTSLVSVPNQFILRGDGFVNSVYAVAENISKIMSAATMPTILEEEVDIMFQRIRDTLRKEKQLIAEVTAEVTAKAKAEVYQEIAEWDQRRRQAEARGEPFTEPPPAPPEKRSKK